MSRLKIFLGIVLLLTQVVMIVYARFVPAKYFCWAPYDAISLYSLDVKVNGRTLAQPEIQRRYRFERLGRDNRNIQHIKDIVTQYENTYGKNKNAKIIMRYTTNGHPQEQWQWPHH